MLFSLDVIFNITDSMSQSWGYCEEFYPQYSSMPRPA